MKSNTSLLTSSCGTQLEPTNGGPARLATKDDLRVALKLDSTRKVDDLMRSKKIPFIKLGHRTVRFDLARVLDAIARLEIKAIK